MTENRVRVTALSAKDAPVLAELWNNYCDAVYDTLEPAPDTGSEEES